jgi:hypothetical protein
MSLPRQAVPHARAHARAGRRIAGFGEASEFSLTDRDLFSGRLGSSSVAGIVRVTLRVTTLCKGCSKMK